MKSLESTIANLQSILASEFTELVTERDTALALAGEQFEALTADNTALRAELDALKAAPTPTPVQSMESLLASIRELEAELEEQAGLAAQLAEAKAQVTALQGQKADLQAQLSALTPPPPPVVAPEDGAAAGTLLAAEGVGEAPSAGSGECALYRVGQGGLGPAHGVASDDECGYLHGSPVPDRIATRRPPAPRFSVGRGAIGRRRGRFGR